MRKFLAFLSTLVAFLLLFNCQLTARDKVDFSEKGEVHDQVIRLWNTHYREYFASEIKRRLFEDNDVYVLYDIQIGGLQSFVEMTRRCRDTAQIAELVTLLTPVFSMLKPVPDADNSKGWICNGGRICTAYGFLGKEVTLCSVQYLGLVGALAGSISENIPPRKRTAAERTFLAEAFNTMAVQMNRWLTPGYFTSVEKRLQVGSNDIRDASSRFFFSDRDLWYLTVLSDLAELDRSGVEPAGEDGKKAFESLLTKKEGIARTFDLFLARTVLVSSANGVRADLDQGFWRYHFDNRYAGYSGPVSPVSWEKDSDGKGIMKVQVEWDSAYIARNTGWDISHSRRLVPALETFARNRQNIKKVWGYRSPTFDPVALRQAFARQITDKIWNGDRQYPLFSNFWSGDNGWYRVAYANQTGRQFAGYPPYGLSVSIADGGYPIWGAYNPTLHLIFRNIYGMLQSDDAAVKDFISKHYRGLSGRGNLAFLSDLVSVSGKPGKR
ncbi:hypothetical protein GCM10023091_19560 [Ravibacter arvi]|uniref:Uncharacterized protein n=1 Tax=Ravibacter arvi TaxID=2051041 RepID=A0ABP8LY84_9BACT